MDRRSFLRNSAVVSVGAAFFLEFPAFSKVIAKKGEPNIRIGILSDIHIREKDGLETLDTFRHALEYFRERGVDGVMIAGDMADRGFYKELQWIANTWFEVFPGGKAPDGHKVETLFICGNHDAEETPKFVKYFDSVEEYQKECLCYHKAEYWENCFKEKYAPVYMKTIKGYNFIGAHWCNSRSIDGLAEFIGKHHKQLAGDKPFFYFQHPHLKNTCNGPWAWGQDDGTVTEIFSHYPNAIAFSGHSHCPLSDERDLWQGSFTSIGTASRRYLCPIGARENSEVDGGPREDSEMKAVEAWDGRQGMLMSVYDDCIALEKRDFMYDEPIRENWIIPLGVPGAPLSFENRAKTAQIPQFNPSDKVYITRAVGEDRKGDSHKQVTVHFPSVLKKTHGVRAFDYEVCVEARYVDVFKQDITKRVYSPKFYLGEDHDGGEVVCVFAESELPQHYEVRFAVRPCECFGGKGEPIYSEWVPAQTRD